MFVFSLSFLSIEAYASDPKLNFSDLISGPDTGLGDGVGSGVIVTVWGQHLGSSQGNSTITFIDSGGIDRGPVHVYYWKNADGLLPSGPSNLYASHRMQEIAFSIPNSNNGLGQIIVTVGGKISSLPFTVRDGDIYHVKPDGNNNGNGTFNDPWLTVEHAIDTIDDPGSTLYIHDVDSGCDSCPRGIIWDNNKASSTLAAQFGFIAYPNTRPTAMGAKGMSNFTVSGQVISKFDIYASNFTDVDAFGQPSGQWSNTTQCFETDAFGRGIANRCTDIPGQCASAFQAAITGNTLSGDNEVDNAKIFGNEVYEYGCEGGSKHQHTTYMSVRSGALNLQVEPWEFGWNYLHDNHTKNGIHQYDENLTGIECGSPTGNVLIHDNVIVNQAGAGISVAAQCPWHSDFTIYNNVLINTGRASSWNGVDPNTLSGATTSAISIGDDGLMGTVHIFNNTIMVWNDDDPVADTQSCLGLRSDGDNVTINWDNNVCLTDKDKAFVAAGCCGASVLLDNVSGLNNAWFYSGTNPSAAIVPTWDTSAILIDPKVTNIGSIVSVGLGSSLIGKSPASTFLLFDIYGNKRSNQAEIGAAEFIIKSNPPSGLTLN